ncbi:hypothetical protein F5Y16DRAFT_404979 [Xylariaceae sp. FL0255]|nr:hypothetical protein F5Y16DRAFT_404979 [Xylariaceae sp. FL0255]
MSDTQVSPIAQAAWEWIEAQFDGVWPIMKMPTSAFDLLGQDGEAYLREQASILLGTEAEFFYDGREIIFDEQSPTRVFLAAPDHVGLPMNFDICRLEGHRLRMIVPKPEKPGAPADKDLDGVLHHQDAEIADGELQQSQAVQAERSQNEANWPVAGAPIACSAPAATTSTPAASHPPFMPMGDLVAPLGTGLEPMAMSVHAPVPVSGASARQMQQLVQEPQHGHFHPSHSQQQASQNQVAYTDQTFRTHSQTEQVQKQFYSQQSSSFSQPMYPGAQINTTQQSDMKPFMTSQQRVHAQPPQMVYPQDHVQHHPQAQSQFHSGPQSIYSQDSALYRLQAQALSQRQIQTPKPAQTQKSTQAQTEKDSFDAQVANSVQGPVAASTSDASATRKRKVKPDEDKTTPPNSWILFRRHYSEHLRAAKPNVKLHITQISVLASPVWAKMTAEQKKHWEDLAARLAEEFYLTHPNARPGKKGKSDWA